MVGRVGKEERGGCLGGMSRSRDGGEMGLTFVAAKKILKWFSILLELRLFE